MKELSNIEHSQFSFKSKNERLEELVIIFFIFLSIVFGIFLLIGAIKLVEKDLNNIVVVFGLLFVAIPTVFLVWKFKAREKGNNKILKLHDRIEIYCSACPLVFFGLLKAPRDQRRAVMLQRKKKLIFNGNVDFRLTKVGRIPLIEIHEDKNRYCFLINGSYRDLKSAESVINQWNKEIQ